MNVVGVVHAPPDCRRRQSQEHRRTDLHRTATAWVDRDEDDGDERGHHGEYAERAGRGRVVTWLQPRERPGDHVHPPPPGGNHAHPKPRADNWPPTIVGLPTPTLISESNRIVAYSDCSCHWVSLSWNLRPPQVLQVLERGLVSLVPWRIPVSSMAWSSVRSRPPFRSATICRSRGVRLSTSAGSSIHGSQVALPGSSRIVQELAVTVGAE